MNGDRQGLTEGAVFDCEVIWDAKAVLGWVCDVCGEAAMEGWGSEELHVFTEVVAA
jgi:hypothetical protein